MQRLHRIHFTATPRKPRQPPPTSAPFSHQLCLTSRLQSSQFWQSGVVSMLLVRPRRCKYSSIDSREWHLFPLKKGCSSPCKLLPILVWYTFEQSKGDVDASRACGQIVRPHRCKYSSIEQRAAVLLASFCQAWSDMLISADRETGFQNGGDRNKQDNTPQSTVGQNKERIPGFLW